MQDMVTCTWRLGYFLDSKKGKNKFCFLFICSLMYRLQRRSLFLAPKAVNIIIEEILE